MTLQQLHSELSYIWGKLDFCISVLSRPHTIFTTEYMQWQQKIEGYLRKLIGRDNCGGTKRKNKDQSWYRTHITLSWEVYGLKRKKQDSLRRKVREDRAHAHCTEAGVLKKLSLAELAKLNWLRYSWLSYSWLRFGLGVHDSPVYASG